MVDPEQHLFIFAGEHSGDLHGARLIKAMREQQPNLKFWGVGGPLMREQQMTCQLHMEEFQVMGFTDVLFSLPKLGRQFIQVRTEILNKQPKAVILIDYPGFNLRLAKSLRNCNYKGKIIQYVSPSVWAWAKNRIPKMAATLDLLLTIYPFESEYFSETSLSVKYVGNPLVEILSQHHYNESWKQEIKIPGTKQIIAIFPGSRPKEIERNLPKLLEASELLKQTSPEIVLCLSVANEQLNPLIEKLIRKGTLKIDRDIYFVPKKYTYELMRDCHTAVAKSGTVTLELALHQKPTVVVYQMTTLNRFIAQYILRLKLPFYCIVNILMKQMTFPELIATKFTAHDLYLQLSQLYKEGAKRFACIHLCSELKEKLKVNSGHYASKEAALAIGALL